REGCAKPPGRYISDVFSVERKPERLEQRRRIAFAGIVLIEAAHDRLQGLHLAAFRAQLARKQRRHIGFAYAGARRCDKNRAHSAALRCRIRPRTICARRSISSSLCCAVNVKRSRAVPGGTVGGRMPVTRKPSSSSRREASSVF